MKIDQIVTEIFQDRLCRWRTIDELTRTRAGRKAAFDDEIVLGWFDSSLDKLRIEFLQLVSSPNGFYRAEIGSGSDERFVGAFAEQKLQCADDNRFARAGLASDGSKAWRNFPLEFFHEREILDAQQCQDGGHSGR